MTKSMLICIDSCVFILGLQSNEAFALRLFDLISPNVFLIIPRLIAREVTRNLDTLNQIRHFYAVKEMLSLVPLQSSHFLIDVSLQKMYHFEQRYRYFVIR